MLPGYLIGTFQCAWGAFCALHSGVLGMLHDYQVAESSIDRKSTVSMSDGHVNSMQRSFTKKNEKSNASFRLSISKEVSVDNYRAK